MNTVTKKQDVDLKQEVSSGEIAAYGAPFVAAEFFYIPMLSILPGVYAKYYGLDLAVIASTLLLIRLTDAAVDPLFGYLSDRHRQSGGSRKTWVAVGVLGLIFTGYNLFVPSAEVTASYYLAWSFGFFVAWTILDIPHMAWGGELTYDYDKRARVYAGRSIALRVGILAFYSLPLLPFYISKDYTPQVFFHAAIIGSVAALIGLAVALRWAPAGHVIETRRQDDIRSIWRSLYQNKPLLIFFAAYFCIASSFGMWFGLLYLYLDGYLYMTDNISLVFTWGSIVSIASVPFWVWLIKITNKHRAWAIGIGLFIFQLMVMAFVDRHSSIIWTFLCIAAAYTSLSCLNVASLSVLGDIVDYGKLKFKKDRGGTYFAICGLVTKVGLGIGAAASLGIAGLFGYEPGAKLTDDMVFGLRLGFVWLPLLSAVIGTTFILATPITRGRYNIISRRLSSGLK